MSIAQRIAEHEKQAAALKKLQDLNDKWQKDAQEAGFTDFQAALKVLIEEDVVPALGKAKAAAPKAKKSAPAKEKKRFKNSTEIENQIIKFLETADHTHREAAEKFGASIPTIGNIWRKHKAKKG